MEIQQVLDKVKIDIENAEEYFDSYVKPKLIERYQIYNADKEYYKTLFKKLSQRSSVVSTDVADVVEWALPSLMRIFFGGEDVVVVRGRTADDVSKADKMQKLLNFQIQVQNPGFLVFYRWFKDAFVSGLGVIKCWWEQKDKEETKKTLFSLQEIEILKQNQNIEIENIQVLPNNLYAVVTYKEKVTYKNQPVFDNIPPNEFIFYPDAASVANSSFSAHRKLVTVDYLRRMAQKGVYSKKAVEEAIQRGQDKELDYQDELMVAIKPDQSQFTPGRVDDKARMKFKLYECYTKYDINDDGLLEPVIVTVVNNVILRVEENLYERPPFFTLAPILEPYEIWGKSFSDIIGDIQHIKTALIRQILVNIALNNDPKTEVVENLVNLEDVVLDKSFIRVKQPNSIKPLRTQPLAPWTYNFLEYIEQHKENRTGISRYIQGLDPNSLNKTATGIQLLMGAGQQRLELVARIFAETGIKDFFRFLIGLNQRFISEQTVIRLTNEEMEITPDDLQGKFDLEINTGVGIGVKEQNLRNMQMLLQIYPQLTQVGIVTPKNIYNFAKKYFETLGFKNADDFITDPDKIQQQMGGLNAATGQNEAPGGVAGEIFQGAQGQGLG